MDNINQLIGRAFGLDEAAPNNSFNHGNHGTGFRCTFSNGYTVSLVWGAGAHCDENTCEIAAFNSKGWYHFQCLPYENDDVYSNVTPEQVAACMAEVAALHRRRGFQSKC